MYAIRLMREDREGFCRVNDRTVRIERHLCPCEPPPAGGRDERIPHDSGNEQCRKHSNQNGKSAVRHARNMSEPLRRPLALQVRHLYHYDLLMLGQ